MKSIDEAGVEWHLSHPDADKEETWKAGANYVLEQVENIVLDKNTGLVEMWSELMTLIEQLKK